MYKRKNGYVAGAALLKPMVNRLRDHVEFEKFICRTLKDDERTRKFKENTQYLDNKLYDLRYNDVNSIKLTAEYKKNYNGADK